MYLGTKLHKTRLHSGVWAWAMSPAKYVQETVRKFAVHLSSNYGVKYRMPKKTKNPFEMGYDPGMDTSPELDPDAVSHSLIVIVILRWMIELGRIDIITKLSLLSYHVALPREGHLEAAVQVITHVCQRYNFSLMYDPSSPEIDHTGFKECDRSEFYRDAKEAILVNTSEP